MRSPHRSGRYGRVRALNASLVRLARTRWASSLARHASRQVRRIKRLKKVASRLTNEKASRKGWPKTISAGDKSQSGSGILRSCNRARRNESLFKSPLGLILDMRSFSGFDCNLRATVRLEEVGGRNTVFDVYLRIKSCVTKAVNSGPPSEEISSGTPKVAKYDRRRQTSAFAAVTVVPAGVPNTSDQPDNLSPTIKKCRPA